MDELNAKEQDAEVKTDVEDAVKSETADEQSVAAEGDTAVVEAEAKTD